MNKLIASFIFIALMMFMVFAFLQENKKLSQGQERFNTCVTEMQRAIPDPNDTEGRSSFLQTCEN
jgi:hypothetical protein